MKFIFWILLIFGLPIASPGSEDDPYADALQLMRTLEIPEQFESVRGFNPTTYLEMFTGEQVSRFTTDAGALSKENESKLRALFLAASKIGMSKYKQDYWISKKAPMVKLLGSVCPDVLKLEEEPGGTIRMYDIALTLEEEQKQAIEKKTGVIRPPDDEIWRFYGAEVPKEKLSRAAQYMIRSNVLNRFGAVALPNLAKLIAEENEDVLLALWWQHTNRSVRTSILAILLCRNGISEVAPTGGLTMTDFEGFAKRFTEPEAKMRQEEIRYVKENFINMAANLARMTSGIERVSKIFSAYTASASSGAK